MEVVLDGVRLEVEPRGETLQDVIQYLLDNEIGSDRALKGVLVNGAPYSVAEMGPATAMPVAEVESLEIETALAREVAMDFMAQAPVYLGAISQAVSAVAELFRVADERDASEQYIAVLESLQLFLSMLEESRRLLQLDLALVVHQEKTAAESLESLSALIKKLLDAQEKEDWVLLADLLEYDLAPELDNWSTLTGLLREQALS